MSKEYPAWAKIKTEVEGLWGSLFHYEIITEFRENADSGRLEWTHSLVYIDPEGVRYSRPLNDYYEREFAQEALKFNWQYIDLREQRRICREEHNALVLCYLG